MIDVESFDEISATTEMEVETATEQKLTTENIDIPEENSIDTEKYPEQPSILDETFVEDQVQETPRKPVHVYQKPDDEFLEPPEEKHKILSGWSNREIHWSKLCLISKFQLK